MFVSGSEQPWQRSGKPKSLTAPLPASAGSGGAISRPRRFPSTSDRPRCRSGGSSRETVPAAVDELEGRSTLDAPRLAELLGGGQGRGRGRWTRRAPEEEGEYDDEPTGPDGASHPHRPTAAGGEGASGIPRRTAYPTARGRVDGAWPTGMGDLTGTARSRTVVAVVRLLSFGLSIQYAVVSLS